MNVQRRNAAVTKFGEQIKANVDGARIALKESDKNYTDPEIEEIISFVLNPASPDVKDANKPTGSVSQPSRPNDEVQEALKSIDYSKLVPVENNEAATAEAAANLAKYFQIVGTLVDTQQYDFTQYKAAPVLKKILNDNADKVTVMVGIRLVAATPINQSRMQMWAAKDLNSQINNPNNPATNSRFYFLTKY